MASTAVKVVLGLLAGTAVGGGGSAGVAEVLRFAAVKQAQAEAHKGWYLNPVTVAKRDLEPGTTLSFDDISMRSFPEGMVTASLVKPEGAPIVVRQQLQAPMHAGDPLWWEFFQATTLDDADLAAACTSAVEASGLVPKQVRSTAELRARLAAAAAR